MIGGTTSEATPCATALTTRVRLTIATHKRIDMPPRKTITIIRKKLGREKADGLTMCDGKVYIDIRQSGASEMDTVLHELLHHVCPYLSEEEVAEKAAMMARSMWKDNWRRVSE
jgi:hypothetical protein